MSQLQKILTLLSLDMMCVMGASMAPIFRSNDYVLVKLRRKRSSPYPIGSYILLNHPIYGDMIKRIHAHLPQSGYRVTGENNLSTSSQHLGLIQQEWIHGHVIFHIPQQGSANRPRPPENPTQYF